MVRRGRHRLHGSCPMLEARLIDGLHEDVEVLASLHGVGPMAVSAQGGGRGDRAALGGRRWRGGRRVRGCRRRARARQGDRAGERRRRCCYCCCCCCCWGGGACRLRRRGRRRTAVLRRRYAPLCCCRLAILRPALPRRHRRSPPHARAIPSFQPAAGGCTGCCGGCGTARFLLRGAAAWGHDG